MYECKQMQFETTEEYSKQTLSAKLNCKRLHLKEILKRKEDESE